MHTNSVRRLVLRASERRKLARIVRSQTALARDVLRARIIIRLGKAQSVSQVARELQISRKTVRKWRERFLAGRLSGLEDLPRPGRTPVISEERVAELHARACSPHSDQRPKTQVELARESGISRSWVGELLRRAALKPWQVKSWCHSLDPNFRRIVKRICSLYRRKPLKNQVILSLDEKTCIQAIERSYCRGCAAGRATRRQADYKRYGIINLFAALDVHTGHIYSRLAPRKRASEFISFLSQLDRTIEQGKQIILILDNISTHSAKLVRAWLAEHPGRFQFEHTPTHASWLNQIELFFSKLTRQLLTRASFTSLNNLKQALRAYIHKHNHTAQPYNWTFSGRFKEVVPN